MQSSLSMTQRSISLIPELRAQPISPRTSLPPRSKTSTGRSTAPPPGTRGHRRRRDHCHHPSHRGPMSDSRRAITPISTRAAPGCRLGPRPTDRPTEDTNAVLWYTLGSHHLTRPEDWPVMPVERTGFALKPRGFFDQNPALDIPPPSLSNSCGTWDV
jgi:Copper amine oxidase, enzyme domain